MPARVTFDPYAISRELELRVGRPHDPTQEDQPIDWVVAASTPDELGITYELSDLALPWRQIAVDIDATLPIEELKSVLPHNWSPPELGNDVRMVVSVRCSSTKTRFPVVLERNGLGGWSGSLKLNRNEVKSVVELVPAMVRARPITGAQADPTLASEAGSVLAEGHPIRLVVDETERPIRGALEVHWEDFRESTNLWRSDHARDIQYLEFGAGDPRLWLNSRYTSLKAALHSGLQEGQDAILKNMANALMAQTAWVQLSIAAIGSIRLDEDNNEAVAPEGWKGLVLKVLAPRLLPSTPEGERLAELAERFRDPDRLPSLVTEVGTAVQEQLPTYKRIEAAVKAGGTS